MGEDEAKEIGMSSEYVGDITLDCYTIVEDHNGDFIVVDLNRNRVGLCYDAFHETYGLVGNMPIIAQCFSELIELLIENKGESIYWLEKDFIAIGDAYDNIKRD